MESRACNILFQEDKEDYLDDPIRLLDFEEHAVFCGSENYLRRYYRKKLESTNNTQYPKTKQEVIEIKKGTYKEEIVIIDLTKKHTEYNHDNKEKILEAHGNEFTNIDELIGTQEGKGTYETLSIPVLNIQNESNIRVISEAEQDSDLIISEYSRTIDKEIQKLKSNIEYTQNNTNGRNNLSSKFLLGSKSFIKNRVNFSQATKEKTGKVPRDVINNDSTTVHYKKKNSNDSKKIKCIYRCEPITKTKLKIIKSSLKSKNIIPHENYYIAMEQKGCSPHQNATNNKQCDNIKTVEKKPNSLTNKNKQNHYENKLHRVHSSSYINLSQSSPVLAKIITETKKSTASHRNIGPERLHECFKQLPSSDIILPNFHRNAFLNRPDILSKSNTEEGLKRTKEIIKNYEIKKNKQYLHSTKDFNITPKVSQIPKPSMQQIIHCIKNNNAIVNGNKTQKKICNTNVDILNNPALYSVNLPHVTNKLPGNNEMIPKKSHASPDVIIENVNNIDFISQSKIEAAQLEEERLRYLLPSNCKLPDPQMQNIFAYYGRRNFNTCPYIDKRI